MFSRGSATSHATSPAAGAGAPAAGAGGGGGGAAGGGGAGAGRFRNVYAALLPPEVPEDFPPITKQRLDLVQLFRLERWQGVAVAQLFYIGVVVALVLVFVINLIVALASGYAGSIVAALILMPIFLLFILLLTRLSLELVLSVLLLPFYLHRVNVNGNGNGDDDERTVGDVETGMPGLHPQQQQVLHQQQQIGDLPRTTPSGTIPVPAPGAGGAPATSPRDTASIQLTQAGRL